MTIKNILIILATCSALFLGVVACNRTQLTATKTRNIKNLQDVPPTNFCGPTNAVLNTPPGFDGTLVPLFAGLTENFTYPITIKSKVAQKYFTRVWYLLMVLIMPKRLVLLKKRCDKTRIVLLVIGVWLMCLDLFTIQKWKMKFYQKLKKHSPMQECTPINAV